MDDEMPNGGNGNGGNKAIIWTAISSLVGLFVLLRLLVVGPVQTELNKLETQLHDSQVDMKNISVGLAKVEKVQEQGLKTADYLMEQTKKNCP